MEKQETPHKKRKLFKNFTKLYIVLLLFCIVFSPKFAFASPFQTKEKHYVNLQINNPFMTVDGVTMLIDAEKKVTPIYIDKWERVVIPISGVLRNMGAEIKWDAEEKKITITKESMDISTILQINNSKADVNNKSVLIDEEKPEITPIIHKERAFVTVVFISKVFKTKLEWSPNHEFVTLTWVEP